MKKIFSIRNAAFFLFLAVISGMYYTAFSRSGGIVGVTRKGNNPGCTCHGGSPTPSVNVQWLGPDTVNVGQTVNFSLVISGGPLVRAGTNIAARNGTLAIVDNSLRAQSGELTHTSPKAPSGGNVTFAFSYRAPNTPGLDTIFANGNSVDNTGDTDNDNWNFAANRRVIVRTSTGITQNNGIPVEFALSQNYPNPFNPETVISFSITSREFTSLQVIDITGRVVATLVNEVLPSGIYSVKLNAGNFASGMYFYSLTSGSNRDVKKMTVLK